MTTVIISMFIGYALGIASVIAAIHYLCKKEEEITETRKK
jgi:hypothetical protein